MERQQIECDVRKAANGVLTFAASTETLARDDAIIEVKGWDTEKWEANPVVLFNHDPNAPVGRGTAVRKVTRGNNKRLEIDVEFSGLEQMNELAESVRLLVQDGFLRAGSVGFIPKEFKELTSDQKSELGLGPWGRVITKAELLEFSIVSVPADPGALKLSAEPDEYRKALACVRSVSEDEEGFAHLEQVLSGQPVSSDDDSSRTANPDVASFEVRFDALDEALETIGSAISALREEQTEIREQLVIRNARFGTPAPEEGEPEGDDERDLYGIANRIAETRQQESSE